MIQKRFYMYFVICTFRNVSSFILNLPFAKNSEVMTKNDSHFQIQSFKKHKNQLLNAKINK